jgi:EAL domain-containing protein (putative c-di-GMP-specific phosphodiesterase class I)
LPEDRPFVARLGENNEDAAVISAIIGLAHAMNLEVIAEGVENAEQLARLRELGCDLAQGNYLSGPLPAEELDKLLTIDPDP